MKTIRIAMHGVTGRMGANQHFLRSILQIMRQGGVKLSNGETVQIEPVLVGRRVEKLRHLAECVAVETIGRAVEFTTDVEAAISDAGTDVVFDAASTQLRPSILLKAIQHQKAIYCEKPISADLESARQVADACVAHGIKNGVVQDKLWLPGIRKLKMLINQGFFGQILSVRGDFGYWVFSGHDPEQPAQRPSWNYRREDGGGMMLDMFCHWHYLISELFGPIDRVLSHASTDVRERVDEDGMPYQCTADDSAYALFVLSDGVTCQFNSSWATRVRRDDLLTIQVDGTRGSAVAGLRECWTQSIAATPRPVWNPDLPQPIDFFAGWQKIPNSSEYENAFKVQWELFLRHVATGEPFPWSLRSGVEGLSLAIAGQRSSDEVRWVSLDEMN